LLALGGLALLILRLPNAWGYGLIMLSILALGHGIHLIAPDRQSDFAGFVRLTQLAAYPLLLALPRRFSLATIAPPPVAAPQKPAPPPPPQPARPAADPKRLLSALEILTADDPAQRLPAISRVVAENMLADICLLLQFNSVEGVFQIPCGYDLIREEHIAPTAVRATELPLLTSAMIKERSLRLPASSTSQDMSTLASLYQLSTAGHLLVSFVPHPPNTQPLGIVLLSPYSNRRWNNRDQQNLEKIAHGLAPILHPEEGQATPAAVAVAPSDQATEQELAEAKSTIAALEARLEELQAQNARLQAQTERQPQPQTDASLASLEEEYRKAQETLARLQVENRRLGEMVESLIAETDTHGLTTVGQLKKELQEALEEIAHLKNQLALADQRALALEKGASSTQTVSAGQIEMLTTIIQDLRQPLSSIVGYTELLLGESVGILGALQRKFLERVRASAERMQLLLDDLIQLTTLEGEGQQIKPQPVDLGSVLDNAIADTRAQMREKNISLRVDLPDPLPRLQADRDALQQICINLLNNATTVSPPEGEILLRAEIQHSENERDYVLLQVADQGGGIPEEDLPRVFSRLYRADNPLIEGVGDNGVGLSIVKTLVEAHGGRIWVDTERGKGSTFNVLLPLSPNTFPETAPEANG
ncbi:MAG: hypothetical protein D6803_04370, partial [Anaerolineae bacterium]